jgi:hypothetical protein
MPQSRHFENALQLAWSLLDCSGSIVAIFCYSGRSGLPPGDAASQRASFSSGLLYPERGHYT